MEHFNPEEGSGSNPMEGIVSNDPLQIEINFTVYIFIHPILISKLNFYIN